MAKEAKKSKSGNMYKVVDVEYFKENFNENAPMYEELCKGESVSLNPKDKNTISWLVNNIIIKE